MDKRETYGTLVVIGLAEKRKRTNGSYRYLYLCRCVCGKDTIVNKDNLENGHTKSCGCLRNKSRKKYIGSGHKLYSVWRNMKQRCSDKNKSNYKYYGGKGIAVCNEWSGDYDAFYKWAMENGWSQNLQLDRIDSSGDYTPTNCQFITKTLNIRKRDIVKLSMDKAKEIRLLYKHGGLSQERISELFNVTQPAIGAVVRNEIWV